MNPAVNGQRGYVLSEAAKGKDVLDHKEFYHVGRELNEEQQERLGYYRNIWPDEMEFGEPIQSLFGDLERLMDFIETAVAEAIDLPGNHLTDMTVEGDNLLRIIHYPPMQETSDVTVWAAEHTDIDLFTILPRATNDGLEVQDKNGDWIRVKVPEDAFIIKAGDMLENVTNGYFRSSRHRVVAAGSTEERFSMVLFIHPRSSDPMDPLPHLIKRTGGIKKFADATRWELLMERLADLTLATPEMLEELADSGLMERLIEVERASPDAMRQLKKHGFASPIVLKELERLEN